MHHVESMIYNIVGFSPPKTLKKSLMNDDYASTAESVSTDLADFYIKEETTKEESNKFDNS